MSIFQHFRNEEKPFIEKMTEWVALVSKRKIAKCTDFLDPRQVEILTTIANRSTDVHVFFHGGYDGAERVRAWMTVEDEEPTFDQFGLALIQIENRNAFSSLNHRDYLGALLHLGLIRDKFGDVLVRDRDAQIIVHADMVEFALAHLHQVGRSNVLVQQIDFAQLDVPTAALEEKIITVASLRLDAVLAEVLRLARAKVQALIKSGKVKVNWKVEESAAVEIHVHDTLSVRGFGRFVVIRENGRSKKGKIVLAIGWNKES